MLLSPYPADIFVFVFRCVCFERTVPRCESYTCSKRVLNVFSGADKSRPVFCREGFLDIFVLEKTRGGNLDCCVFDWFV